jgi:protein TonB
MAAAFQTGDIYFSGPARGRGSAAQPEDKAERHSAGPHWWRQRGAYVSLALHAAALLAVWQFSARVSEAPPAPLPVELIRVQAPPELIPPPPEPLPKPEPVKEKPLAPPRPVERALPAPKTVAVDAAKAETATPPPVTEAPPPGPVAPPAAAPAVPAPAAPAPAPAPKVIATEGIPSDYVNQVFSRINRNTDYPREAKQRRQQGKVGYKLTLSPQGALLNFDIDSSGNEVLDEAAREAIRRAAPFPPLPDLGGSSYTVAGNIVFKLI